MIRTVIIDDEPDCVRLLSLQLKMSCSQVEVVAECHSGEEGLKAIRTHHPQVVFLDVEMPRMNGFQLLEALDEITFAIIFVTAYDRFALKAFRFSALDYLLKPVDTKDLQKAVHKVEKFHRTERGQVELLKQHLQSPSTRKIALPFQNGVTFVELSSILYCEADNNYSRFVTATGEKYLVSKTLREVQEVLEGNDFLRLHRQYLVNVEHIKKFVRGEGSYIVMADNKNIPVAKRHKDQLMEKFGWL